MIRSFRGRAFAALTMAVVAAGCGGGPKDADKPAAAPDVKAPAAVAKAGPADFGVPECDEYLQKYLACVDSKVPASARAMVRQSLEQTREQWKKAAATPEGRAGLATGCKMATDGAKAAMSAYGCQW